MIPNRTIFRAETGNFLVVTNFYLAVEQVSKSFVIRVYAIGPEDEYCTLETFPVEEPAGENTTARLEAWERTRDLAQQALDEIIRNICNGQLAANFDRLLLGEEHND